MTEKKHRLLRLLGYCTVPVVAVLIVMSAHGGAVNPEVSAVPAILAMTFPLWALLSLVMLAVCLAARSLRRLALLPALALALSWGPLCDFAPLNFFSSKAEPDARKFTVMSFNTYALYDILVDSVSSDPKQWKREIEAGVSNPTINYIIREHPDIICGQEFPALKHNIRTHFTKWQVDTLTRRYPWVANESGEAVLSPWPMKPVKLRQPDSPYAWFAAGIADIQGHETLLVSVHMQSIGLDSNDKELYRELTEGEGSKKIRQVKRQLLGKLAYAFKERALQARLLREQIDSLGIENVIVAGDFNDIPSCYALRVISGDDFRNAFTDAGFGPIITYHANRFYFHIDHIVYRGKMRAIGFERGDCPNSDHYPVTATFVWGDD